MINMMTNTTPTAVVDTTASSESPFPSVADARLVKSAEVEKKLIEVSGAIEKAKDAQMQAQTSRARAEEVYAETRRIMENFVKDWNTTSAK
ncbi:unnamed protein product [Amoebophrya sp. A25]|nr:unnamed protein product [Amoebophrya sp. A25]|eukprot:GSA25T00022250001.1